MWKKNLFPGSERFVRFRYSNGFPKNQTTTGEAFSQVVFSLNQKNRLNKMISYCSHVSV